MMDNDVRDNAGSAFTDVCNKKWPKFRELNRELQCLASVPYPQNSWLKVTQVDHYGNIVAGTVSLCSDFA